MKIITIDNMYEDDGVAQLQLFFMASFPGAPTQMKPRRLLAIVPEHRDDGAISKVHVLLASEKVIVNPTPEQVVTLTAEVEAVALARIVSAYMNAQRQAAEAKLTEPTVVDGPSA